MIESVVSNLIQSTSLYKMPSQKPSSQGRNNAKLTQPTKIPKTNSYFLVHNLIEEKKKHGRYSKKKKNKQTNNIRREKQRVDKF